MWGVVKKGPYKGGVKYIRGEGSGEVLCFQSLAGEIPLRNLDFFLTKPRQNPSKIYPP